VGFEDDGVSANCTYVHAANDSDRQNESNPYIVSGGSEHDEEGAMESNFDELDAELFGYDSDAQTPCDDKTEQQASLGSGFPFERRKAEVGSQTGKKEKDAAIGSLERELDDEKSAKTAKLFQKILDIHGELRNKTADLDKDKHPILRQRHQNALNTIHEKLKTARAELASLDADMALVELASLNLQG
jgi:TATA-binding protein-associated factor Taf7